MKRDNKKEVMNALIMVYEAATEENSRMSDAICTSLQLINFWQDVALDWEKDRSGLGNCSIVFHWSVCGGKQYIPYGSKIPEARG